MLSDHAMRQGAASNVEFRAARAADGQAMVEIFRISIPETISSVHVLGAPMAAAFVRDSIDAADHGGDSAFWVAEQGARPIGFVQLRRDPSLTVVEHLHVMPSSQGQGIGSALLRVALGEAQTQRIGIDVFRESDVAVRLYRELGFEHSYSRNWRVLESGPRPRHDFYVRNLPQARAIHDAYSISILQIDTPDGSYEIGRIGDRWFRVVSARAIEDDALRYALWRLDPTRAILAVLGTDADPYGEPPMLVSHRLEGRLADLTAALSSRVMRRAMRDPQRGG